MSRAPTQVFACAICLPLLVFAGSAAARSYQTEYLDGYIARCSTVNTSTLPEASLAQYRLEPDPRRGLLTCLVQEDRQELEPENVSADVRARFRTVGHTFEEVSMREVVTNDLVSYLGVYDIRQAETLQFEVVISLPGAGRLRLQFDDLDPQL
jgi:hypothetical protein